MPDIDVAAELLDPALILERMEQGFYAIDLGWRIRAVNRRAEEFWGRSRSEILGRSMLDLFPQFEGSASYRAHALAMERQQAATVETISTATGRPVVLHLYPNPNGLSVYFRDIQDRHQMEQELRARDELLTLAEMSAGIGVWVQDVPSQTTRATAQFYRLLGVEPIEGAVSQDFLRSFRHPDDRDRVTQAFQKAVERGEELFETEYRIIRPSGEERWILGRGRLTRDETGRPKRYSGVDLDITERRRSEEHLRVVMGELAHRTSNLLAVVQGLARQSARGSTNTSEFLAAFEGRLQALSASTKLLIKEDRRDASLRELIESQVTPFCDLTRFELEGPPVRLSQKAVQNLSLAFHELATNALKHGALSNPDGRISVRWTLGQGFVTLVWSESGGPPVAPPKRKGFGRVVAEQIVSGALGADVSTEFLPQGLRWTVVIPPSELRD